MVCAVDGRERLCVIVEDPVNLDANLVLSQGTNSFAVRKNPPPFRFK